MPSLCVELDDDDCDDDEPEALSFAIPVGERIFENKSELFISFLSGDVLSCRPNLYNCTLPITSKSSSEKSSMVSSRSRHEKIYTRTLNLLNKRQCTIPFELSVSDSSFLSIEPSTITTLTSFSKVNVQCHLHLSQDLIDRFHLTNLNKNESLLSKIDESTTIDHGRKIHWREELAIKFKQNEMEQIIPIDIRLYFPILTVNCTRIDFGTCFLEQTRQQELILKNLTCSSSAWSIRKGKQTLIIAFLNSDLFSFS
jgi:hypothetical protein